MKTFLFSPKQAIYSQIPDSNQKRCRFTTEYPIESPNNATSSETSKGGDGEGNIIKTINKKNGVEERGGGRETRSEGGEIETELLQPAHSSTFSYFESSFGRQ